MMSKFTGVITALVTPFQEGKLDLRSLRRLVQNQLKQGVDGFVVNGTTGESPTLEEHEVQSIFETVRAESPKSVPVIVGTGSNSTVKTCEATKKAQAMGADAALVVVPYYNRPPQRGLQAHFEAVARSAPNLPVILYNVPSRTVAKLDLDTTVNLSCVDNIVGIKEASGDMAWVDSIKARVGREFILLSGDDGTCVDFCARGGHGVISVSSHVIGAEMKSHIAHVSVSDYATRYARFMKNLYIEANPIPVKMALHWMGILDSAELRLPLVALDESYHKEFKECLKELKKI